MLKASMASGSQPEVEIKFRVADPSSLPPRLRAAGFRLKTRRTAETNILFDSSDRSFSARGEVLRLRQYGKVWTLTHKSRGQDSRHKVRNEIETEVSDGLATLNLLEQLGFSPAFRYEKFRTEWTDGRGQVVVDETPIGDFGEIEGSPAWIDRTAKKLGISEGSYLRSSYIALFFAWKKLTGSAAADMTWKAVGKRRR
jgi:adenylate cyclase, class 2